MSKKIPNINNLHNEKIIKEQVRNEMFNVVLNKCIDSITYTNKYTDKTYILFKVPDIMEFNGVNRYDKMSCITYLIQQFTVQRYMVEFVEPFYIYIDWGTNIVDKNVDYIQKIIPTSNPSKLKKQTDELLKKYPNTSKVTYVYEDAADIKKKKKK